MSTDHTKADTEDNSDSSGTSGFISTGAKSDTEDNSNSLSVLSKSFESDTEGSGDSSSTPSDAKSDSDYGSMRNNDKSATKFQTITGQEPTINVSPSTSSFSIDLSAGSKYNKEETMTVDTMIVDKYIKQRDASSGNNEPLFISPEGCRSVENKPATEEAKMSLHSSILPADCENIEDIEDKSATAELQKSLNAFINDLLTSDEFSVPANHLLNCLCVIGPVPIPLFVIEELDKIITKAATAKGRAVGNSSEALLIQELEVGVLRRCPDMFLYHKDFNPEFVDHNTKQMYVPKLFCDVIKRNMSISDIAVSVACVQHAVRNVPMERSQLNTNQLCFMLMVLNQLDHPCSNLHAKFKEENIRLKIKVAYLVRI